MIRMLLLVLLLQTLISNALLVFLLTQIQNLRLILKLSLLLMPNVFLVRRVYLLNFEKFVVIFPFVSKKKMTELLVSWLVCCILTFSICLFDQTLHLPITTELLPTSNPQLLTLFNHSKNVITLLNSTHSSPYCLSWRVFGLS